MAKSMFCEMMDSIMRCWYLLKIVVYMLLTGVEYILIRSFLKKYKDSKMISNLKTVLDPSYKA